jgi:hypothetical protein
MLGNIMADNVLEAQVYPVNELGEIVMQAGVGTSNVVGYVPSNFVPSDAVTKKMVVVGAGGGGGSYTLPVATTTTLGGVKQGVGTNVAGDGTMTTTGSAFVGATVTSTSTLPATALGSITPVNSAAAVTLTLPSAATAFSNNPFGLLIISQLGAGVPSFAAGGGDFLRSTSGVPTSVQYGMIAAQVISATEWALA